MAQRHCYSNEPIEGNQPIPYKEIPNKVVKHFSHGGYVAMLYTIGKYKAPAC
jgi:hypothetical protein